MVVDLPDNDGFDAMTIGDSGYSEIEMQAMEHGWKPQEQFKGASGKKWRDAETYMDIHNAREEAKRAKHSASRLEKIVEDFGGYIENIRKNEREKTLAELNMKRDEAIELGDVKLVKDYDNLIKKTEAIPDAPKKTEDNPLLEHAKAFAERNADWFNGNTPSNRAMVRFAEEVEAELLSSNETLRSNPEKLYRLVETQVKSAFNIGEQPRSKNMTSKITVPTGRTAPPQKTEKFTRDMLSKEEQKIMDGLLSHKVWDKKTKKLKPLMEEKDYLEQLGKSGAFNK